MRSRVCILRTSTNRWTDGRGRDSEYNVAIGHHNHSAGWHRTCLHLKVELKIEIMIGR